MDTLFGMPEVNNGSGKSNEWYTPSRYVEAAREVMGSIDLDPASCDFANQTVKAKRYYAESENGLLLPWTGNIWLNPPYGKIGNKSVIEMWIRKLIQSYEHGSVTSAILLTTCDSDNVWFQLLWDYIICFTDHNVHFFKPDHHGKIYKDSRHTQMFGTVFAYFGPDEQRFIEIFSQFGVCAKRVSLPPAKPRTLDLWNDATTLANEIATWDVPGEQREESVG